MARPSKVFLRKLRKKERELLRQKLRDKTMSARIYERYRVIDVAQQGFSVPEIAERSGMHVTNIYDWIAHFNSRGFVGFDDPPNPEGRPSLLTSKQLRDMVKIALSRPADLGLPYTHWSVAKLRAYLIQRGFFPDYTDEWVRRLLKREGVSFQRTKTWKESPDPDFEAKKPHPETLCQGTSSLPCCLL
jgi:transposase